MPGRPIHAVYYALNELAFFKASLASVYDSVDSVTVVTRYDRDRYGEPVEPAGLVEAILSRAVDPDRKIELLVTNEGSEPAARNRAMAVVAGRYRTLALPGEPPSIRRPGLFWHIDSDEVYDPVDIPALLDWVDHHPALAYRLRLRSYFRSWNWQIEEAGSFTAFTRPSFRFGRIRDPYPSMWARAWEKAEQSGRVSDRTAWAARATRMVPASVAVCHHGSYVGSRERVAAKFTRSAHIDEASEGWLKQVWDHWTPEATDFHPVTPSRFPRSTYVPTESLPAPIRNAEWPDGWIERNSARGAPGVT